tara:strand:+ start:444 stop:737 length:294 start_codon:yes stop_codon:yes gene_type:complete
MAREKKLSFVKSGFRSPWIGVVLAEQKRMGSPLLLIAVIFDRNGNLLRKRKMVVLDAAWTQTTECREVPNPDWLTVDHKQFVKILEYRGGTYGWKLK